MAAMWAVTEVSGSIIVGSLSAAATALGAWALVRNKRADVNQNTAEWLVTEMRNELLVLKAEVSALRSENAELRNHIRNLEFQIQRGNP